MRENADPFRAVRKAKTSAPNYDLDTDAIIAKLQAWSTLCQFRVTSAKDDALELEFDTLPTDLDAFIQDLYAFCPDIVDQGTACVPDMVESMDEIPDDLQEMIEGLDLEDENIGFTILKRELERNQAAALWWD
jgi:hypothetical protein